MENIDNAFNEAMNKICGRCFAHSHCEITKTKCAEYEMLSAIRDELVEDEKFIVECDELVQEIQKHESNNQR